MNDNITSETGTTPGVSAAATADALVQRCLAPATGLCLRAFDPSASGASEVTNACAELVSAALCRVVPRRRTASDDAVRRVMARVAGMAHDQMMGSTAVVMWPEAVPAASVLGPDCALDQVAPDGRLELAMLQDCTSAMRAPDRQIAFMVLAAGLHPDDAGELIGRSSAAVSRSLRRIGRRLRDGLAPTQWQMADDEDLELVAS